MVCGVWLGLWSLGQGFGSLGLGLNVWVFGLLGFWDWSLGFRLQAVPSGGLFQPPDGVWGMAWALELGSGLWFFGVGFGCLGVWVIGFGDWSLGFRLQDVPSGGL